MRLFEFVDTSGSKENFYNSTLNFANNWIEFTKSWSANYTPSVAEEETIELTNVANSFLKSMEAGAIAYRRLDTLIRDELEAHWAEDNLNSGIIHDLLSKRPKEKSPFRTITDFSEWKSEILKKNPNAVFSKQDDKNINATENNNFLGQWVPDLNTGSIAH